MNEILKKIMRSTAYLSVEDTIYLDIENYKYYTKEELKSITTREILKDIFRFSSNSIVKVMQILWMIKNKRYNSDTEMILLEISKITNLNIKYYLLQFDESYLTSDIIINIIVNSNIKIMRKIFKIESQCSVVNLVRDLIRIILMNELENSLVKNIPESVVNILLDNKNIKNAHEIKLKYGDYKLNEFIDKILESEVYKSKFAYLQKNNYSKDQILDNIFDDCKIDDLQGIARQKNLFKAEEIDIYLDQDIMVVLNRSLLNTLDNASYGYCLKVEYGFTTHYDFKNINVEEFDEKEYLLGIALTEPVEEILKLLLIKS